MGNLEVAQLHSLGFEEDHLTSLRVETTSWGVVPYVVTCSNSAKLLHYNGAMKPWLLDSDTVQVPVCTMPQALSEYHFNWVQESLPKLCCQLTRHDSSCQAQPHKEVEILGVTYTFVTCSEIWSLFLADDLLYSEPVNTTAEGVEELQRREDAKTWANKINADREKQRRKKLAGGYYTGQTIQAAHDISVRGKIVVRKNCEGVVQGPSLNHPTERLNVLFKA
eukprot:g2597.t1